MSKDFVNLHTHSHYTILEAPFSPQKILEKAQVLEHKKVALTDRGNGHGLVEFVMAAEKTEGVEPILGCEIAVSLDGRFEKRPGIDGREGYVVLLAQNQTGYRNLLKIISVGNLEGFYYQPRVDLETLEKHSEGLVLLTGARLGLVGKAYFDYGKEKAVEVFEQLRSIFGAKNTYLELVTRSFEEQRELNIWKAGLSGEKDFPVVVTSDARYADPADEAAADVFWCIGKNQNVNDPTRFKGAEQNWFKSWEAVEREMTYIPPEVLEKARANTVQIADGCDVKLEFGKNLLPKFEVPEGETEASWLRKECEKQIDRFYTEEFTYSEQRKDKAEEDELLITPELVQERLDYELSVIGKMGFDAYFLIVADFIDYAKDQGIFVGPGRGSAAGSIVSYLLGITSIDPLRYELLFERFLNPERISMPDIDIDFSDVRREEVMDYVVDKYGTEQVSKVCTFGTLAAKAALKDVGRALGVEYSRMNAMTKLLPNRPGFSLEDAKDVKDFMDLLGKNADLKHVYEVAEALEGSVRHVSVHACAVIIGNSDLSDNTPVQWAPGTDDVKITQYPYQQLEALGLLKMDFLGLKNLSVLEQTLNHIRQTTGQEIDLQNLPLDDKKVFQMMSEGETTGVFQFESAGMRRYLRELKPTELEDLVAMNALYRPGPMEYIPQYVEGKHNPKKVKYPHEVLQPILRKTYGIAVYQEQVLRIAQDFAGFSLGEADILRKAIGKKIASILAEQRKKFIEGAVEKGHSEKEAKHIFDEIVVPFAGYGFNRSHAVCYARIAYETAYMRANYPVEFMAAMMTTDRNNTDRIVLEMNECQAMGIEVFPPSVNQSGSHFTVIVEENQQELDVDLTQGRTENFYDTKGKKIRFGLTAIKGLGEETADIIIAEREQNGTYKNLQDFAKRVPAKLMNKKTLEALAFSGAFDEFGNRGAIVAGLEELAKFAKETQEKKDAGQIGLFGGLEEVEEDIDFHLQDIEASQEEILNWERDSLGLFVSDHPLKGLSEYFEKYGVLIGHIEEVEEERKRKEEAEREEKKKKGQKLGRKKKEKRSVMIHGMVTTVRRITTKAGAQMAIMTVEDTSGSIECAVFPKVFEGINRRAFEVDAFLQVTGRPEERDGVYNFIVEKIKVGNLKSVQAAWSEQEEKIEEQKETVEVKEGEDLEGCYEEEQSDQVTELPSYQVLVEVPDDVGAEKILNLKRLLFEHRDDRGGVVVAVREKGVERIIPFGIRVEDKEKLEKFFVREGDLDF